MSDDEDIWDPAIKDTARDRGALGLIFAAISFRSDLDVRTVPIGDLAAAWKDLSGEFTSRDRLGQVTSVVSHAQNDSGGPGDRAWCLLNPYMDHFHEQWVADGMPGYEDAVAHGQADDV